MGEVYGEDMSLYFFFFFTFGCGFFLLVQCVGVTQLVSGISFRGTFLCIVIDLVYPWEEVSSRAILDPSI